MASALRAAVSGFAGVLLLVALVAWAGPHRLLEAAARAEPAFVVAAAACYATFFLLRGWRWALLLRPAGARVEAWSAAAATSVGWLANNVLPMRAGEVVRAGVVARRSGAPFLSVASTVAVERVLDVAGLAVAAALGAALVPAETFPPWAAVALAVAAVAPLVALALLAVAALARERLFAVLAWTLRPLPEAARGKALALAGHVADGAEPVVRRPRLLAASLALTAAMTVAQAAIYALLVKAFLPATPWAVAVAGAPWFILTFAVALTPANVGTYEAAFSAIYGALGVAPEAAFAAGVLTHLATFGTVVLLGSASLAVLGASPRDVRAAARRPSEA